MLTEKRSVASTPTVDGQRQPNKKNVFLNSEAMKFYLLPKVPQKLKILQNKKNFITSELKNTSFLFGQR